MSYPTVGVIGAGQLARMMIAPATSLGVNLIVLAEKIDDSAAQVGQAVVGDYRNLQQVLDFAKTVDLLTFEHELIPPSILRELENAGVRIYPLAHSFEFSQSKIAMRRKIQELGLPNPRWEEFSGEGEPRLIFPLIAKRDSGGYDGRGVFLVQSREELHELFQRVQCALLLEEKLDFDAEIAVMVARSPHGQAATWSPTTTVQSDGICRMTITPSQELSSDLTVRAQEIALHIAQAINLVGVMAVELFLVGEELVVNELALRPHNSGHWTIEGSRTSQFEQHLRAILDLPLGSTEMTTDFAVMGNILGGEKSNMYRPYLHLMARTPGLKFHSYRKEVRLGRKVGHVTLLGSNLEELKSEVAHAIDYMTGVIDE